MSLVQLSMRALSKGAVSELYTAQILDVGWSKSLDFVANKWNERSAKDVNALQIHLLRPVAPDDLDHQCFRDYRVLVVVDHLLWRPRPSVGYNKWAVSRFKVTHFLRRTFLDVCWVGHEWLGYFQDGQLSTENPMVVVSLHTTPWACGDLDGIAARRDIRVNYRSIFECSWL